MTRRLCRLALVGATVSSVVLAGAEAAQAAEQLTKESCKALEDDPTSPNPISIKAKFTIRDGTRTCTVVEVYDESLGIDPRPGPEETDAQGNTVRYVGEVEDFIRIRYTRVFTQQGDEDWSMTGADKILRDWTVERCYLYSGDSRVQVDNSECESRGLL
jgi:hypothetical protein